MRVYHFLNAYYGLESIEKRRLKISRLNDLNDPFEFYAVNLTDDPLRGALKAAIAELNVLNGLLCFSKNWNNPLLWGHYADKHKGLCLGFDIPDKHLIHVTYLKGRLEADSAKKITENIMHRWLHSKYVDWAYEDETRVFVNLNDICEGGEEKRFYFADYSNELQLKQVIVGCNSTVTREQLDLALGEDYATLEKFKSRAAFKDFKIVRNKNSKLWK